jgi:hypothetical protein
MYNIALLLLFLFNTTAGKHTAPDPPSKYFDLNGWKLQIPGPKEVKDLTGYSSNYFYLADDKSMLFDLNAAETGTTKNAHFVRSELRHLLNWETGSTHSLSSTTRVTCDMPAYKVTVLQIHGIQENKDDAPPLLRIAVINGDLYSFLKSDNSGDNTEKKMLLANVQDKYFSTAIHVEKNVLTITVNGKVCLSKELSYWNYLNYFKLGCYPQVTEGNFKIYVKEFSVS